MSLLKFFGIFLAIFLFWYFTGGPERSINLKPYLKFNMETATIDKSDEELKDGLVGQVISPIHNLRKIREKLESIGK